jgi:hypothetical protein
MDVVTEGVRILLTGVPGTGKTTLGERLAQGWGLAHLDMEQDGFVRVVEFRRAPARFVKELRVSGPGVVSWGFGPRTDLVLVKRLVNAGYQPIWLDGNRVASLRAFLAREGSGGEMERIYYEQMAAVMGSGVVEELGAVVVNPFDARGRWRSRDAVAREVLAEADELRLRRAR